MTEVVTFDLVVNPMGKKAITPGTQLDKLRREMPKAELLPPAGRG